MTLRAERAAEAARLRDEEGLNALAIAKRLGLSRAYTYALLRDPEGNDDRERKDRNRGTCETCGAKTDGSAGRANAPTECASCMAVRLRATRRWTEEAIVAALRDWAEEHGRPPTPDDWRTGGNGRHPPSSTVVERVGWGNALRLAGLPTRSPYRMPALEDPSVKEKAARLVRMGVRPVEIAEHYGVTPSAVRNWLDAVRSNGCS